MDPTRLDYQWQCETLPPQNLRTTIKMKKLPTKKYLRPFSKMVLVKKRSKKAFSVHLSVLPMCLYTFEIYCQIYLPMNKTSTD